MAAGETRNVLVLYSNSRLLPANIENDQALRQTIATSAGRAAMVFDEFLDVPRFGGQDYEETVATYLRQKYASKPPVVIVAAGEEALRFILQNRTRLFGQAPIVHVGVSKEFLAAMPPLPSDVVGVPVRFEFSATVEQALRWHPRARHLVVVTGESPWDRAWEGRLRNEEDRFRDRVTIEALAGLPTGALLKRLGELGQDTVVFTPGYFEDGEHRLFAPRESIEVMAGASGAPMYGPHNTHLGHGIVGGFMWSFAECGRQAGQIVNDLLSGAAPASLRLPQITPTTLNVDWREIQRWGIPEKAIPANAVVHFKEPSFLEQHRKGAIIAAAGFLLQTGLIAGLLMERHRRRRAELTMQLQASELAHASRVAIAGELTGAIAHEINQPLGAILSNAEAAELLLESGPGRCGELRNILADIRRDDLRASEVIRRLRALLSKHEVERKPFELSEAIREVESVLGAEARRRGVSLSVRPSTTPAIIVGDRVQIQQVLMNLVLNAMDAVAEQPEDRRTVVVSVENVAGDIAVSVHDRGRGIAPDHLPKVFDSFFSTKRAGMGLGLSIARTIVQAHGGRIWAENVPENGAVLHVEFSATHGTSTPSPERA